MRGQNLFEMIFNSLWNTTIQASVLIVVVMMVQWLLSGRLDARWRFSLWWLVVIRLLLPATPESSFSLFNHFRPELRIPSSNLTASVESTTSNTIDETAQLPSEQPMIPSNPGLSVGSQKKTPPIGGKDSLSSPWQNFESNDSHPQQTTNWKALVLPGMVAIWASGALLLFGIGLFKSVQISLLMRKKPPIRLPQWEPLLEQCRSDLGVSQKLELAETPLVSNPLVFGLFRPKLLLPLGLSTTFTADDLRHIFLHELAHVKRRDLWLNWLLSLLQAVHWFNPVVWIGLHRLHADRESACDEMALVHSNDSSPVGYGETLLKLVERLPRHSSAPGMVGILEGASQMKRRMSLIVRFRKQKSLSLLLVAPLIAGLAMATLTDAKENKGSPVPIESDSTQGDSKTAEAPPPSPIKLRLTLKVIEAETGEPISNAKVQANYFYVGRGMEGHNMTTDANGLANVPEPRKPTTGRNMNIFVTAETYAPKGVSWGNDNVPTDYTLRLDPANTIGGIVVNEENKPVSGVEIKLQNYHQGNSTAERIAFHPRQSLVTSDIDGAWSSPYVPKELETVELLLTHPDFAVTAVRVSPTTPESSNLTLIINRGWRVNGVVLDTNGLPISNATVREAHNFGGYRKESTQTAVDGTYSLNSLVRREAKIVVQAEGYAPLLKEVDPVEDSARVNFRLERGRLFQGRVVDESGNPLADAAVLTDTDNQGLRKVEWETRTDQQGRFKWESAPAEPLLFWFESIGFLPKRNIKLEADGSDHIVTLNRRTVKIPDAFQVSGRVQDAESGADIPRFKVLLGKLTDPYFATDFTDQGTIGSDGRFRFNFGPRTFFQKYVIQIQADGYLPVLSRRLLVKDGDQELEFALERSTGPSGQVLLPNGEPAHGADICMIGSRGGVYMDQPGQIQKRLTESPSRTTDIEGRFAFEPALNTHSFIVVHPRGYAEVPAQELEENNIITLSRYARLEGTLFVNGTPFPGKTLNIRSMNYRYKSDGREFNPLSLWLTTTTDTQGRFVFEKVPPGERKISHRMDFRNGSHGPIPMSHSKLIQFQPGKTSVVKVGGTGRSVIGRLAMPEGVAEKIDWKQDIQKLVSDDLSDPSFLERPQRADYSSTEDFREARKAHSKRHKSYWMSSEGRAKSRNQKQFVPLFDVDGSFRISDVPPGDYTFMVSVTESKKNSLGPSRSLYFAPLLGSLTMNLRVPELEGVYDKRPLDLGLLVLEENIVNQP